MVNSELSEISYVIQAGVTTYPIGFEYHFNENNSPQLLVKIGESVAIINVDFQLSADESEIILIPTEEEAKAQTSPSDTRWMDRIVGKELLITRDIPFVQTSDYSVGRINPEQIEYDFDRAAMRDQEILHQLGVFSVDVALAESLANTAVETANDAAAAANQATATANTALNRANTAIVTASEAKTTATQASKDAVDAMADAASAVNKADAADMTATTAMEIAAEAVTLAQSVYSKKEVDDKIRVINAGIDANAVAIQKTRADFIESDSEIHTILNNHAGELNTLHNDVDEVGDQVSGIEEKIPGTASATNPLVTKADLEGLGGGDFLPLSGGTITGQLLIDVGESPTTVGAARALAFTGTVNGAEKTCWFSYVPQYYRLDVNSVSLYNTGSITPNGNGEKNIGSTLHKFNTVYTNQISSAEGAEAIIIPDLSGTMARIEDLIDLRADINEADSELQTQITAQAAAIAGKQKQLEPGDNVFINRTNPDVDIISVLGVVSSLNGLTGALNLQAGDGIEIDGLKISATGGGSGGASYTAGDGIDITDDTISTDTSVIRNTSTAKYALGLSQALKSTVDAEGGLAVGNYAIVGIGANYSIAIGTFVQTHAPYAIQIGGYDVSNIDANTLKVGNENGNFEMMDANGNVPLERLTYVTNQIGDISTALTAILGE